MPMSEDKDAPSSDEMLRRRAVEFDAAIDKMIDALQESDDVFGDRGVTVTHAATQYARALHEASNHVPQEIGEHYVQLARNLHIEVPFLIFKLNGYRERRA